MPEQKPYWQKGSGVDQFNAQRSRFLFMLVLWPFAIMGLSLFVAMAVVVFILAAIF